MELLYIGHAGILVKEKDLIVAIDPFLSGNFYWDGELENYLGDSPWIGEGKKKFIKEYGKQINAILITHAHGDHFDLPSIIELLKINPNIELILPYSVVDWLKFSSAVGSIITKFLAPVRWDEKYEIESELNDIALKISILPNKGMKMGKLPERIGFSITNELGTTVFHPGDSHGTGDWDNIDVDVSDLVLWGVGQRKEIVDYFYNKGNLKNLWWIHWEKFEPGNFSCNMNPKDLIAEFSDYKIQQGVLSYKNWIDID